MIRLLWHDILSHRLAAGLFALCWVGSWVITVVVWNQTGAVGLPTAWEHILPWVAGILGMGGGVGVLGAFVGIWLTELPGPHHAG